jgi:drug/metabolite transporter (DMT)-like permease
VKEVGISGLLNSTIPLWVAILALLIFKKCMSKLMIIGLATGFSGLMLLVAPSLGSGTLRPIGTAALIISSILWAHFTLFIGSKTTSEHASIFWDVND